MSAGPYAQVPLSVVIELGSNPRALVQWAWLRARYGHPGNREHPSVEQLARETHMSVATWHRVAQFSKGKGCLRIVKLSDDAGQRSGAAYIPVVPSDQTLTSESQGQTRTSESKDSQPRTRKSLEASKLSNQTLTGDRAIRRSDQYRSDQDLAIDHRGSKKQPAAPTAAQQQHALRADEDPGGEAPPDPPEDKTDEALNGFYAMWRVIHHVPYDRRPSDRVKVATAVAERGVDDVVTAIPLFFACGDVRIIGADRLHPLGLFTANIGRLLATATKRPRWCDHDPECRNATQHRDRILEEGRAERAALAVVSN